MIGINENENETYTAVNDKTSVKESSIYNKSIIEDKQNDDNKSIKKQPSVFNKSINERSSILAESILANSIFSDNNNDINETINAMSLNEKFIEEVPEDKEMNNKIISDSILREKSIAGLSVIEKDNIENSPIVQSPSIKSKATSVERHGSYAMDSAIIGNGDIDRRPSFINKSIIEEEEPKFINEEDMIDENDKHYMERSIIIEEPIIKQTTIIDPSTITSFEKSKINKSRTESEKKRKSQISVIKEENSKISEKRNSTSTKSINSDSNSSMTSRNSKSMSVDYSITSDADRSTASVKRKILSMLFIPNTRSSTHGSVRSSRLFGVPSKPVKSEKKRKTVFTDLPDNAIQLIFKYIGETYSIEFKHTCSKTYRVGNHPDTIAKWLYYYYDPKVLTIPESDQQIAFKNRVIVTSDVIASIVNNIDEKVVEDFDDNLKNSLTAYALKKDDLNLLQALFKPFCFNVEVGLVSIACQNQNRTSQEFISYLFEKDFILPKSTFFEACLRYNTYVINCYLNYNDITHKEIDDYFKSVEKRPFHPMVAAARAGDMTLIRNLIDDIGCSLSLFGYYAFIKAISHNRLNIAKYIFNLYPQLDLNDNEMMNIVSKAAERGRLETIRLIKYVYDKRYGKSKSVNIFRKPGILANAITASALAGQLECCVWLMEREKKIY